MKQIILFLILSVVLSFSSGCAYWYQQGKTFDECDQDLDSCYKELKMYADMRYITYYEDNFMKDCMKEKGYQLVGEDKLPRRIKRRDPDVHFWLLAGVAGKIQE